MSRLRVGVLRGGMGCEYDVSLKTGGQVLNYLPEQYQPEDILITKDGTWHHRGLPLNPTNLPHLVDVVFNCLHGEYGEDGRVQKLLDDLDVFYTGSGHLASRLGMNKILAKNVLRQNGLKVAQHLPVQAGDDLAQKAREVFLKFAPPYVVKPADRGSSVGLFFVPYLEDLAEAIADCLDYSDSVMVEEYIRGREATCGVVANFRGEPIYALLPIEIVRPSGQSVWNYIDKYSGETKELVPGPFSPEHKVELERLARTVHELLGLRHYSRTDFIVSPRGIYVLEVNTLPGLTAESLLPKSLTAIGVSYPQFLEHIINLAINRI
ncbi:MAG: D-alanine--D-alanine ligase [Patescibacteria group bacterium]|mgnify:CR=1 FL=1